MKKLNSTHLIPQRMSSSNTYSLLKPIFSALLLGFLLFSSQALTAQVAVSFTVTDISCNGNDDGSITAQGSGGWAPYTYNWSNGATGATISGLAAGAYTVTVIDIDLGQTIGTAVVGQACCLNLFTTASYETCDGSNDATATVIASGGTAPYTYLWSDGQTTDIATGLSAGIYTVTVTDANGIVCEKTQVVDLSPEGLWIMLSSTDAVCGEDNGTAHVSVMTGTAPFTYIWSNGNMTADPTGLAAGVYTVTVTDANNCTNTGEVTVNSSGNVPDPGVILTNDPTTFCTTDMLPDIVNVTVSGNPGPNFTFIVTTDAGEILIISTTLVFDFTNAPPGICRIYGFAWDGNITGLDVGNNLSDIMGCTALSTPIIVTREDCTNPCTVDPGIISTNDPTNLCVSDGIDDLVDVTVTGNTGMTSGWIITDATGVILALPAAPPFNFEGAGPGNCIIWHVTYDDITGLATGNNANTDLAGCFRLSNPIIVTRNENPTVGITPADAEVCAGGSLQLTAVSGGGGLTYAWTASGGTFDDPTAASPVYTMMMPGTYDISVTVTDFNGCTGTGTTTVTIIPTPTVNISPENTAVCQGESVSFTSSVSGTGVTYSWSATGGTFDDPTVANPTYTMMMPGTYTITLDVVDDNGCSGSASTTVTINENPTVTIDPQGGSVCAGEELQLSANATGANPLSYSWTASGGSFNNPSSSTPSYMMMMPGTYDISVTVTDGNGCAASATTTVTVNPAPTADISPENAAVCQGESVDFTSNVSGNGPFSYQWTATGGSFSDPLAANPTYTMMMPGTYDIFLIVIDANGCATSAVTTVTINANPTVEIDPMGASTCAGQPLQLNANASGGSAPLTYSWTASGGSFNDASSASPIYTMMMGGTYDLSVTVTDANGCDASATTTVTVEDPDAGTLTIDADPVCLQNGLATISATPDGNASIPAGYQVAYVLTSEPGTIIRQLSITPSFDVTALGDYTIHTLVFDPNTLDPSSINLGTTTAAEVNSLLVQGGGSICAALDLVGAPVNVFMRKIGDYVWIDRNQNGFQDIFEDGYEGATVTLLMAGPDGLYCTADDIIVDEQVTNSDGFYCFECVLPGEYVVSFEINDPLYEFTSMDASAFDQFDSDANEMTGKTDPITINPGDGDDLTIDAGIHLICDNYTVGGIIEADQFGLCPGIVPQKLNSVALPSGGFGQIEYLWMYIELSNLTDPNPINWTPIPNSNSSMYQPPAVFETTLYARCARAVDCADYVESNIVRIEVIDCLGGGIGTTDISAQLMNNEDVKIAWNLGPEQDFFNYFIERSVDGVSFENIGKVEGLGNDNGSNSYEFMDRTPIMGRNYYRVKQVGLNTPITYSRTVDVLITMPQMSEIYAYPNPVKDVLHLEALEDVEEGAVLEVMNALGQVISSQRLSKDEKQIELNFSQYVPGTYFIRIQSASSKEVSVVKILRAE